MRGHALVDRGVAHVAVSGGTTPTVMFGTLATLPVPWSAVHIWQVDERVAPDGDADRNLTHLLRSPPAGGAADVRPMPVTAHDLEQAGCGGGA